MSAFGRRLLDDQRHVIRRIILYDAPPEFDAEAVHERLGRAVKVVLIELPKTAPRDRYPRLGPRWPRQTRRPTECGKNMHFDVRFLLCPLGPMLPIPHVQRGQSEGDGELYAVCHFSALLLTRNS